VYLLDFHAYINEMHGSRSKIPSKNLVHIYALTFRLYQDISRLMVNVGTSLHYIPMFEARHLPTMQQEGGLLKTVHSPS
jgi:hypothetical protein